ncbi:MAG: hypothetical protein JZU65_05715 [Chlorobium sp.]|nr:hypothetical protein [Chlorobium sp.]
MFNDGGRMKDIYCGNPTCQYCGATYGIAELHNCATKQEALRKQKEQSIAYLEKELALNKLTLRDQFALAALPQVLSETTWEKIEDTGQYHPHYILVAEMSYKIADAMLTHRRYVAE